jgi:predicted ferric reductase
VLTWFLGLPFDHVVAYHRFFGRFTMLAATVHLWYYLQRFIDFGQSDFVFLTGLAAYVSGVVIFITSLNYIRRKHFNAFYFSHYSFLGFYGFAWWHVERTHPFLMMGMALYCLDKGLRMLWAGFPSLSTQFRNKGDGIAQVRFRKSRITQLLGMHKVGQYYFVNFPKLSLTEWHPFSVSSGPRERSVELHIRDLGDHTHQVVQLAKERAAEGGNTTYIRIDGPYGLQDFNYRRYPVLVLVGGGVGITPVLGMLKDLYNVGELAESERNRVKPHAIDTVHAVWVLRHEKDYLAFKDELEEIQAAADSSPYFPNLELSVYCSRAKKGAPAPLISGRPDFPTVFDGLSEMHGVDEAALVFACGPSVMVAQLWDQCLTLTWGGRRFDFHHETFEF